MPKTIRSINHSEAFKNFAVASTGQRTRIQDNSSFELGAAQERTSREITYAAGEHCSRTQPDKRPRGQQQNTTGADRVCTVRVVRADDANLAHEGRTWKLSTGEQ